MEDSGEAAGETEVYEQTIRVYRDQLGEPQFGVELADVDPAERLTALHELAAEHFEQQAGRLAEKAEGADAYERGAYGDPMLSTPMAVALVASTFGFALAVLYDHRLAGVVMLAIGLPVDAMLVRLWRRPPYRYTGDYRKPWDEAASLAAERADRAGGRRPSA